MLLALMTSRQCFWLSDFVIGKPWSRNWGPLMTWNLIPNTEQWLQLLSPSLKHKYQTGFDISCYTGHVLVISMTSHVWVQEQKNFPIKKFMRLMKHEPRPCWSTQYTIILHPLQFNQPLSLCFGCKLKHFYTKIST